MPDNPQRPAPSDFRLDGHVVLALSGPDAIAFAQAQFMNDVAPLGVMDWHWSGWLTPKGRVIALFALLRRDEQTLWLVLPDADPETVRSALSRFVFRSKVRIEVLDDVAATGSFMAPTEAEGARAAMLDGGFIEMDMRGSGGERTLRFGPADAAPNASAQMDWQAADLRHGLPRLPQSQVEQWTPQQLSLDRLAAFSVKKGCYPGQEIVARTQYRGILKRRMALAHAEGGERPLPGHPVYSATFGGQAAGEVVDAAPSPDGGWDVLAVAQVEALRQRDLRLASPEGPVLRILSHPAADAA